MASSITRARRWSDDQLRIAAASQRSWRGTARALGLRGQSAGTLRVLKRRASELGIDTSHFTSQRTWSDHELRHAVCEASSWTDVLRKLGLSDSTGARARVKGHAVRLALDVSRIEEPADLSTVEIADTAPDRARLPRAAEQFASAWFSVRGADVAKPEHPAAYDLFVTLTDTTTGCR